MWPMILSLADEVARRLRTAHKKARGVSLTVKCNDLSYKEWQTALDRPTYNANELARRAFDIFRTGYPWVKPVRALTVRAIRLTDDEICEQLSIFGGAETIAKSEAVDKTVDEIRTRFGSRSIVNAATMGLSKMPRADDEIELLMPTGLLNLA